MERTPLQSTMIRSVRYDEVRGVLELELKNRVLYQYSGVPSSVYEGLRAAASPEYYYLSCIEGKFSYVRVG
jgi:hypothetical protein